MISKLLPILLLSTACVCSAQTIPLAWNPSPSPGVINYVLFSCTNAPMTNMLGDITNVAPPVATIPVGTNLTANVMDVKPGKYWFYVRAQKDGVESIPSNILPVEMAEPPNGLRTVVLQYSGSLTNGWYDVGFFKIKPGP